MVCAADTCRYQLHGLALQPETKEDFHSAVCLGADLWGADVDEFKPERWEKGAPHKFAFMPFSHGPRACIGREFTLLEQKITLVKFFQNFDLEVAPNQQVESYSLLKPGSSTPPFLSFAAPVPQI